LALGTSILSIISRDFPFVIQKHRSCRRYAVKILSICHEPLAKSAAEEKKLITLVPQFHGSAARRI
jgi:hypothetical protein